MTENVPLRQRLQTPAGVAIGSTIPLLIGIATQLFTPLPDGAGSGFAMGAVVVGTWSYLRLRKDQQNQQ